MTQFKMENILIEDSVIIILLMRNVNPQKNTRNQKPLILNRKLFLYWILFIVPAIINHIASIGKPNSIGSISAKKGCANDVFEKMNIPTKKV